VINKINDLQEEIMVFICEWVKDKNTPVPRIQVLLEMKIRGEKKYAISNSLKALVKKGYIRRSSQRSNKTSYVQLRGL